MYYHFIRVIREEMPGVFVGQIRANFDLESVRPRVVRRVEDFCMRLIPERMTTLRERMNSGFNVVHNGFIGCQVMISETPEDWEALYRVVRYVKPVSLDYVVAAPPTRESRAFLAKVPELRSLRTIYWGSLDQMHDRIPDSVFLSLAQMPELKELTLEGTEVSDAALMELAKPGTLNSVALNSNHRPTKPQTLQAIRAANPGLQLDVEELNWGSF